MERPVAYTEEVNRYEYSLAYPSAFSPELQLIVKIQLVLSGLLLLIRLSLAPALSWWWVTLPFWILPAVVIRLALLYLLALILKALSTRIKHDLK